jgi:hypothetical protein
MEQLNIGSILDSVVLRMISIDFDTGNTLHIQTKRVHVLSS